MKKQKKSKVVVPKETWKAIAKEDVKYACYTLNDFIKMVREQVPAGTKDEDIRLIFDAGYTDGFYDEIIIDAEMTISVKEKTK